MAARGRVVSDWTSFILLAVQFFSCLKVFTMIHSLSLIQFQMFEINMFEKGLHPLKVEVLRQTCCLQSV